MYTVGISQPRRERTVDLKARVCVVVFAGVCLTATSVLSAQEAVDQNESVAEADQHQVAAEAKGTDAAEAGAGERERTQSTDAGEPAAIATDAPTVANEPEPAQIRQVCRRVSVTGTHFTQRECRTVEEWAALRAQQSAAGRRFARDVQSQSSVIPAPEPGENTPEGRSSGLPNPGSF
jgi:hypothetical protein